MKTWRGLLGAMLLILGVGAASAQGPVLGNIEAPYPNIQGVVKIAGITYDPGAVAYGPVGTPLILTGSNLGASGTVNFIPYKNGVVDASVTAVQANVTMWTSNLLMLTVPAGAFSGLVKVTTPGGTTYGLPFLVTPGSYSNSCPAGPNPSQLQIITSSLTNGSVGHPYSATLGATGGTAPYTWAITSGALPAGLSLSASGTISGTPTAAYPPTELTFRVRDSSSPQQSDYAAISLTVTLQTLTTANVYSYAANSYDGTGNLTGYTDTVMGTWGLTYDTLNRLISGSPSTGGFSGKNYCWAYDAFGNRTAQVVQTASCPTLPAVPAATMAYNSKNWVSWIQDSAPTGLNYDAAGDALSAVTSIGQTYYSYDAEGRVCAVQSTPMSGMSSAYGYLYDADGTRVAKGTITPSPNPLTQPLSCDPVVAGFQFSDDYVLGIGGEELTQFHLATGISTWQRTNVYAAGKLLATYDNTGLHFHLTDPLGTRRMQLSGTLANLGQPETDLQNLPFGDQLTTLSDPYAAQSIDATPLHFTAKERDTESGNDYFGKRYYASSIGRWMSPDRINVTEDRMMNPSSTLNKYAYGANNPLKYVDPDGQDITIYYEAANPPFSVPGHTMLLAYNQATGDSATRSFGPDHSAASTIQTGIGMPVSGTDRFGYEDIKSPDDLRSKFASFTIQTTPEEAQEVINAIRAHPDGNYTTYWNNCTTTCSKLLRMIGKISSHALTPEGFFNDLYARKINDPLSPGFQFANGHDYGSPRSGYNSFQMFFWLMGSNDKSSVTTTSTNCVTDSNGQKHCDTQ